VLNSLYNPLKIEPYVPDGTEKEEDMKPPARSLEFEKIKIGEFIIGTIVDVEYDMEHKFTFQGKETITPAVRFKFALEGYNHNHYSRWMRFNAGNKSNLYNKYLVKLVENIQPDADFDVDHLKGMKIKTLWQEKNDFQSIESIFALGGKLHFTTDDAQVITEEGNDALDET